MVVSLLVFGGTTIVGMRLATPLVRPLGPASPLVHPLGPATGEDVGSSSLPLVEAIDLVRLGLESGLGC